MSQWPRRVRKLCERMGLRRAPFFIAENPDYGRVDAGAFSYGKPLIAGDDGTPQTKVTIGKYCSLADGVRILLRVNHPTDAPSTFPVAKILGVDDGRGYELCRGPVVIGHDVWIGQDAVIMGGVTIGHGAIIGTKAVVARDVAPYAIVAGNPARELRKRFDASTIAALERIRWWDWPEETIRQHAQLLAHGPMSEFLRVAATIPESSATSTGQRA